MQVEVESEELQQAAAAGTTDPEAMLELEPQQVVRTEDAGLGQQLTHQPLEADEGKYFRSSNFYNNHMVLQLIMLTPVCIGISLTLKHSLCHVCTPARVCCDRESQK